MFGFLLFLFLIFLEGGAASPLTCGFSLGSFFLLSPCTAAGSLYQSLIHLARAASDSVELLWKTTEAEAPTRLNSGSCFVFPSVTAGWSRGDQLLASPEPNHWLVFRVSLSPSTRWPTCLKSGLIHWLKGFKRQYAVEWLRNLSQ